MNKRITYVLKSLIVLSLVVSSPFSFAEDASKKTIVKPILLDENKLAGKGLVPFEAPWPKRSLVSGIESHRYTVLFSGQILVLIYEADDGLLKFEDYPFDEFVQVLSGRLILTPNGAEPQVFEAGDSIVLPRGFSGTWEMQDNYRELIIIEKTAYDYGSKMLFAE